MNYNIAIDGPAGAGKSTIAKQLAKHLNFIYVDTGAMYRAIGLYMLRKSIQPEQNIVVEKELEKIQISLSYQEGEQQIFLGEENVSGLLRTEEVGKAASAFAKLDIVRKKLVALQRELAKKQNVVMDGRDIGTHVLPDAAVKIYLTASSKERAKRRYKELEEKGISCNQQEIEQDILARDKEDMNREISPLRQAEDAILFDCSDMAIPQVVNRITEIFYKKTGYKEE